MKKILSIVLLTVVLYVPSAIARNGMDYYPAREGNAWVYAVSTGEIDNPAGIMRRSVDGRDDSAGNGAVRMKHEIPGEEPSFTWLILDSRGDLVMTSLGTSPDYGRAAIRFDPPLTMLTRNAADIGALWELRMSVPGGTQLAGKSFVESTTEIISVPAGTFRNCLRVKSVSYDETGAETDITYSWYAKGIGEVRTEQTTPRDRRFKSELKEYTVR